MDIVYIVNRAIGQVAGQRGWDDFHTEWVDFTLPKAGHELSKREFQASNEHWFLVSAEDGISIESDRGKYNPSVAFEGGNEHGHSGQIIVSNQLPIPARAVFIRMVASKKKLSNGTGSRDT